MRHLLSKTISRFSLVTLPPLAFLASPMAPPFASLGASQVLAAPGDSSGGRLEYWPTADRRSVKGLMVVIHGCLQSPEAMALGTGLNEIAQRLNWAVLYPQVPPGHPMACWSWYEPTHQSLVKGSELTLIRRLVQSSWPQGLRARKPVVAIGMSSGAATAAGLAACWPDVVRGAVLHSGPAYASARSAAAAVQVMTSGPGAVLTPAPCKAERQKGKVLILHGEQDAVVHPSHARASSRLFSSASVRVRLIPGLGHEWLGLPAQLPSQVKLPFFLQQSGQPQSELGSTQEIEAWLKEF